MVVRRTIHKLRQRPEDERAAFATAVAIGVGFLLFIGWAAYFLATLGHIAPPPVEQMQEGQASSSSDQLQLQQVIQATSAPDQATSSWGQ